MNISRPPAWEVKKGPDGKLFSHLEWPNIHFRNLYSGASKTIAALAAKRNNWDLLLCTRVYCTVLKDGSFCSLYASKIHASLDSYPGPNYVTISTFGLGYETNVSLLA